METNPKPLPTTNDVPARPGSVLKNELGEPVAIAGIRAPLPDLPPMRGHIVRDIFGEPLGEIGPLGSILPIRPF